MVNKGFSKRIGYVGNFDVSNILAGLKNVTNEMKKVSADTSIFSGVENDFEKIEKMIIGVKSRIDKGFSDDNEVKGFKKSVDGVYSSLNEVRTELKEISQSKSFELKDISDAKKQIESLEKELSEIQTNLANSRKALEGSFSNLGFSKTDAKQIAQQVKSSKDLEETLKKTVQRKNEEYQVAKKTADLQKEAAISSKKQTFGKIVKTNNIANIGIADSKTEATSFVNATITDEMKKVINGSISIEDAWEKITSEAKEVGIVLENSDSILNGINANYDNLLVKLQNINTALKSSESSVKTFGEVDADGEVKLSPQTQQIVSDFQVDPNDIQRMTEINHEVDRLNQNISELDNNNASDNFNRNLREIGDSLDGSANEVHGYVEQLDNAAASQQNWDNSFENIKSAVATFFSLTTALNGVREIARSTFEDVKELDKAFASIAMVTNYSVQEMWASYDQYAEMANQLGQSTKDVIASSALYYQQGLCTM